MFNFLNSRKRKIRKLRTDFEDIRARVTFKMDSPLKENFLTVYELATDESSDEPMFSEWANSFRNLRESDFEKWMVLGDQIMEFARIAWKNAEVFGASNADFQRSGADAIALLSILASSKSVHSSESILLQRDIAAFLQSLSR